MCGISYASIVKQRVLLGQNLILPVPGDRKPHPTHFWLDQIGCIACTYQWLNTAASMPATGTPSDAALRRQSSMLGPPSNNNLGSEGFAEVADTDGGD